MCLIAWRWSPTGETPLLWAANRDEFAHRATAPLQAWHHGNATIYSGLDLALEAHNGVLGTWSGFSNTGRFAWLTNIRSPADKNPQAPSRGHLVSAYLASNHLSPREYLSALKPKAPRYNGFNLVLGHIHANPAQSECWHFNARTLQARRLPAGVYGLSNANLDTPWPKTQALVQALTLAGAQLVGAKTTLFSALENSKTYPTNALPATGLPVELEQTLSAAFIATRVRGEAYGTRACTVGKVQNAKVSLEERSYDAQGLCSGVQKLSFDFV